LHWTLYYENSLESSSKWHDGRNIGARGVIAVLFLIVGIFGYVKKEKNNILINI
jgi:hypothetical protein